MGGPNVAKTHEDDKRKLARSIPYEFDREAFLKALDSIPNDVIIEMARDGVICDNEIVRLLVYLGIRENQMETMRQNFELMSRMVMRYAIRHYGQELQKEGACRLTGEQAVEIMRQMLNKGLIERYYTHVVAPSAPSLLPDLAFSKKKEGHTL